MYTIATLRFNEDTINTILSLDNVIRSILARSITRSHQVFRHSVVFLWYHISNCNICLLGNVIKVRH